MEKCTVRTVARNLLPREVPTLPKGADLPYLREVLPYLREQCPPNVSPIAMGPQSLLLEAISGLQSDNQNPEFRSSIITISRVRLTYYFPICPVSRIPKEINIQFEWYLSCRVVG